MNKNLLTLTSYFCKQLTFSLPEVDFKSEKIYNTFYSSLLCGKYPKDMSKYAYIGYNPYMIVRCNKQKNTKVIFEILIKKQMYENEIIQGTESNGENNADCSVNEYMEKSKHKNKQKFIRQYSKYYLEHCFWDFFTVLHNSIGFENLPFPLNKVGLIGYLSYDVVNMLEKIPDVNTDYVNMPLFEAVLYEDYMLYDLYKNKKYDIHCSYETTSDFFKNEVSDIKIKYLQDQKALKKKVQKHIPLNVVKEKYIDKINQIKEYILNGDVYEVNLSALYSKKVGFLSSRGVFELFLSMYEKNSSCYSAFLNFGQNKFISNSPELFLKASGDAIETRPIKGTAPVYSNVIKTLKSRVLLQKSIKDQAELYMIIDLLRNDLSKVSVVGSVKIKAKKRFERYQNYFHTIGVIISRLEKDKNYTDLIKAAFPGGSVTGCPKIRSMEIIEEIEQYKRNIYTGSIFLCNADYLIMSIVIRTAIYQYPNIFFNSGGAITIDSDPEEEYNEIEIKVKNYLEIFGK